MTVQQLMDALKGLPSDTEIKMYYKSETIELGQLVLNEQQRIVYITEA